MAFHIQTIFLPSVGVDIVFDISSLTPHSRSSIIYDTDFENNIITVAQPLAPLSEKTTCKELYLSTIIHEKNRKIRVGLEFKSYKIIRQYRLANNKHVTAVDIHYALPAKEINIRSAFRLPLSANFIIKGKILYQKLEYYTSRDFSIRDISLTGVGLVIPQKKNNRTNPLTGIKINETVHMGLILIDINQDKPFGAFSLKAKVRRKNSKYSDTHCLIGLQTTVLKPGNEELLNKFIHDAQIDELKRLSRRNS